MPTGKRQRVDPLLGRVVGMANTCILGADFLKDSKMMVDVGNSKLSWPGGNIELVVESTTPAVNKLSVLLEGLIRPSTGLWSSPIVLAPKKDGNYRFCVDFRRVNSVTKKGRLTNVPH